MTTDKAPTLAEQIEKLEKFLQENDGDWLRYHKAILATLREYKRITEAEMPEEPPSIKATRESCIKYGVSSGTIEYIDTLRACALRWRADAERYQWLRDRMQIRNVSSVSGLVKEAFTMRPGFDFIDSKGDPQRGWTDLKYFDEQRNKLDAAIDAEIAKERGGK